MARSTFSKLVVALLFLVVSLGCGILCVMGRFYLLSIFCFLMSIVSIIVIVRAFTENTRKVTFMFNAIENNDFTFKFSEHISFENDRMFNRSLNRIKDIMQQTRQELVQREKYYEEILDYSSNGIMVIDPTTGIVFQHNRAATDIFGVVSLTHINQLLIISPDLPEALIEVTCAKNREVNFYNETTKVCLNLSASNVSLLGKNLKIVSMSDIGGQIDNAQFESWIRLSRVLTHEIMNSLAPITSLSEQLQTTTDPTTLHRGLDIIGTTGRGLVDFVDSYRTLTRIPTPVMSDFSFAELLRKQISLLGVEVDISGVSEDLRLWADENMISQVILNLLKNAVEATVTEGEIFVRTSYNARGCTVIEICNSGKPISNEILENIFVPFFTTKQSGSGIGLSLSRQIMRLHNGTLTHATQTKNNQSITLFILQF